MHKELATGRPRKSRIFTYVYETGPAVEKLKRAEPPKGRLPGISLQLLRRVLLLGGCNIRVTAPCGEPDTSRSVLLMVAFDRKDPNSCATIAIPGFLFPGVKLNWLPVAVLTRRLQLQFPNSYPPALRDCTVPSPALVMYGYTMLIQDFMALVVNPDVLCWPNGWFVSQLGECARCRKDLTDITSQNRGIGPECFSILRELPAVKLLYAVMERRPPEEVDAIWNSAVQELVRLGLAKAKPSQTDKRRVEDEPAPAAAAKGKSTRRPARATPSRRP